MITNAVITHGVRTAVAREGRTLRDVSEEILSTTVVRELVERSKIPGEEVEDVIFGNSTSPNGNIGRYASLAAGLPMTTSGITINRQCGAGLNSIALAAQAVVFGSGDVHIAGGVESLSHTPYIMERRSSGGYMQPPKFIVPLISPDEIGDPSMGETAENVAVKYGISREEQDKFALYSHQKAVQAIKEGKFKNEIVPIEIPQKKSAPLIFDTDECPRPETSLEKLSSLRPVFKENGSVTAGNSCPMNDGAAAVLIMSEEKAKSFGYKPLGKILSFATAGVDPHYMGIGPIPSTQKALKYAGLTIDDIDLIELNEAFASQSLAVIKELNIDSEKVNVNGGAIALGHPIGATGTIITIKLLNEMQRRNLRYGLATMCVGGGMGVSMIIENYA